jgi:hypothetical protein
MGGGGGGVGVGCGEMGKWGEGGRVRMNSRLAERDLRNTPRGPSGQPGFALLFGSILMTLLRGEEGRQGGSPLGTGRSAGKFVPRLGGG